MTDHDNQRRARAQQLLKELMRALVVEVEAQDEVVLTRAVVEKVLQRSNDADTASTEKDALLQELAAYLRDLRRKRP